MFGVQTLIPGNSGNPVNKNILNRCVKAGAIFFFLWGGGCSWYGLKVLKSNSLGQNL